MAEAVLLDVDPIESRPPLILGEPGFHGITEAVARPVELKPRQRWRTSINRAAEAMTLFAVACALLFPTIHTGRPWLDYWMMPVPNQMGMWPQFRSPLMWDVFAVSIYGTVSLLFWYVGLVPDLATMRDRSTGLRQKSFAALA